MFDVPAYYRFVADRFPETAKIAERIKAADGEELYPFLWNLLGPLLLNVGMHGPKEMRVAVFAAVEDFMTQHPEVTNEIGAGVIEVAPRGWYEVARDYAGDRLRGNLDRWEPDWMQRSGARTRAADPYEVERTLRSAFSNRA